MGKDSSKIRVEKYLKKKGKAFKKEIYRLGTSKSRIFYSKLEEVLLELKKEGKIKESKIGRFTVYEWLSKPKEVNG